MANLGFDKQIAIRAARARVYAELATPERHVGLQPWIVAVEPLPPSEGADAGPTFVAVEAVPLALGWTFPNRVEVRIERIRPDEIISFEARSRPGLRVCSRFTVSSEGDHTWVREQVRIELPWLLRRFVAPRAEAAQELLLRNLKRRLEAGEATA